MSCSRDDGDERRCAVAIIDGEIAETGWHELDLGRTLRGLGAEPSFPLGAPPSTPVPGRSGGTLRLAAAGLNAMLDQSFGRRIPAEAFVSIGSPAPRPKRNSPRAKPSRSANDNHAAGEQRSVWRDLFFLAILAAALVGAFWSGRVQGYQKVIVVPGPSSFYSVVT